MLLIDVALETAASLLFLRWLASGVVVFGFESLELSALGNGLSNLPRPPGRIPSLACGTTPLEPSSHVELLCSPDAALVLKSP